MAPHLLQRAARRPRPHRRHATAVVVATRRAPPRPPRRRRDHARAPRSRRPPLERSSWRRVRCTALRRPRRGPRCPPRPLCARCLVRRSYDWSVRQTTTMLRTRWCRAGSPTTTPPQRSARGAPARFLSSFAATTAEAAAMCFATPAPRSACPLRGKETLASATCARLLLNVCQRRESNRNHHLRMRTRLGLGDGRNVSRFTQQLQHTIIIH